MGAFDQSAKYGARAAPEYVVSRVGRLAGLTLAFRSWFNPRAVPLPGGPDREADLVAVADDAREGAMPWLLVYEFQSSHDPDKATILQLEALTFLVYARDRDRGGGGFLPLPALVYLVGTCPDGGRVAARTPNGRGFSGDPVVWEVAGDSAVQELAKVESGEETWGALFWVSLMAGADADEVIQTWQRLRDEKVPKASRADATHIVLTFAELAGRRLAWNRVLEGVNMTESAVVNEILEQGEMNMARANLIRLVRLRFPSALTTDVELAIADQPDLTLMKAWLDAAFDAVTAEDFLRVLRK